MFSRRCLMIIRAEHQVFANLAAKAFDPEGGDQTFVVPLGLNDGEPTHYWASAQMRDQVWQQVQKLVDSFPGSIALLYDLDADPTAPHKLIAALGLRTINAEAKLQGPGDRP